ncbi:hypothetical protein SUGI_1115020 [Cryptomeria japonica]|uniref:aquaporin NIP1-3-like n=1 Tax=Cryptomeria japonica TaxID=3369 RepID=UPI002414B884|nr:aquaporin NIP1-3-like [Cryptomeria japonica]GLJ52418.1 hypothetical protein SUGI_1115020 [Cryptomeria japonica]
MEKQSKTPSSVAVYYLEEQQYASPHKNMPNMEDVKATKANNIFRESTIYKKAAAELVATFILVFAGCGGIMVEARDNVLTYVGVNAVFGLVIMAIIYSLGHISGAHINPAVSLAFSAVGKLSVKELPIYIVSQIAGATAAAALLNEIITNTSINVSVTVPVGNPFASLVVEFIITFILALVIFGTATDPKAHGRMAGVAVGGIAACNGLFAGTLSGCSMNPARSVGPALIAGNYNGVWVYIVGPVSGAICGAWFYKAISIQ